EIPALRKVPQTLAAGWGGVGAVAWRASGDSVSALRAPSRHEAGAADAADLERYLSESMSQIMSDLSGLLVQTDEVNRGVETLAREAQRAVESLQEHAQETERELRAIEGQVGDLLSDIDTMRSRADVLRQVIGDIESRASHRRSATQDPVETGGLESQQQEGIGQQ